MRQEICNVSFYWKENMQLGICICVCVCVCCVCVGGGGHVSVTQGRLLCLPLLHSSSVVCKEKRPYHIISTMTCSKSSVYWYQVNNFYSKPQSSSNDQICQCDKSRVSRREPTTIKVSWMSNACVTLHCKTHWKDSSTFLLCSADV